MKRIPGLDGIRAVSILAVMFCHVGDGFFSWAPYGTFGVKSFFVLSGYLITWLLCIEEDKRGVISLPSFYIRRALRILPPAFLFIAFVSSLAYFGWANVARNEPIYCAFFIRNLMPGGPHLAHFWSLAIEEQFYLLWPLGFLFLRFDKRRLIFAGVLFVGAPFWQHLMFKLAGGAANVNSFRFDFRYDPLMAGCCLALLRHYPKTQWLATNRVVKSTPAALLALAMIVAGVAGLGRPFSASLSYIGVAAFINFAIERESGMIGGLLNSKPMVWLGQLSYSLYLWQQPFCWRPQLPLLGLFPQNIVAALAGAALSYYLLEIPLARIRKNVPYLRNPRMFWQAQATDAAEQWSRLDNIKATSEP